MPHDEVTYRQSVSRINQIFEPELSIHVLPLCFHLQTRHRAGLHPCGVEHPGHAQKEIALSLALIVDKLPLATRLGIDLTDSFFVGLLVGSGNHIVGLPPFQ